MAWAEYVGYSQENPAPPGYMRHAVLSLCRFACNSHTITDSDLRAIGVGIYPIAALANHSCAPCAVQTFNGRSIRIRAVRAIKEGEEVTISYLDLADPLSVRQRGARHSQKSLFTAALYCRFVSSLTFENFCLAGLLSVRQKDLQERYLFTCTCEVCSNVAASASAMPTHELNKECVTGSTRESRVALDLADSALALEEGRPADQTLNPQAHARTHAHTHTHTHTHARTHTGASINADEGGGHRSQDPPPSPHPPPPPQRSSLSSSDRVRRLAVGRTSDNGPRHHLPRCVPPGLAHLGCAGGVCVCMCV
jgi:hypothetical protein